MRINTNDLVQAFQGNGDAFEELIHDLVRAVGHSCGIDRINIDWDYRTSVKDGGRDLVVREPNTRSDRSFIPSRRSIWSVKSGAEGVSPASLKNEILDPKHPKVQKALREGWAYVWCAAHPANHDKRDEMREAASTVANHLKIDPSLIEFRWPEQLEGEVNLHPNLISIHFPRIASTLSYVLSLDQWARELRLGDAWVDFGGRNDVVQRVVEHLFRRGRPNVLHIGGLSGIGKTRTVFQACRREPELKGVFYVERLEQVGRELYRYLEEDGRHVHLVIDETPLDEVEAVVARLNEFADRVRVVTIGPAVRQAPITRDEIIILQEPDTDAGVLEVVRAAGPGLSDDVLRSIAAQSGHDLRLALLLVQASQRLPEFYGVPVVNIDGVWQRLMGLFAQEIGEPHNFRRFYEVLTASVDVGMMDDVADEIEALANHFQHPVEHIRETAATAFRCGLGNRTRRFFEPAPRALAARLFAERLWPRIRDVLDQFFNALPERLGRRFLERCHDCAGPVREEVMARLGDFFLSALSGENLTVLVSRPASRIFQTWAEFDPDRGLGWLRQAVERAAPEQLLALDGNPDGSGGWRGRRQLVWLCQNLASFAEQFEAAEAILFRLALQETEPSIGNNSRAVWQSLFWPTLAGTEVPFPQRLPILLHRLRSATAEELPLILGAATGCVEHRMFGIPAPPRIIGGRVVPSPWRPQTLGELNHLRQDAGRQILNAIAELGDDRSSLALVAVAEHVSVFVQAELFDDLRTLFGSPRCDDAIRRQLVARLERQIAFIRRGSREHQANPSLRPLEEWLTELSPPTLAAKVRDLTAQNYWVVWPDEERDARYERLADELIASPDEFRGLADWFSAPEARSAGSLGYQAGRRDQTGQLADIVREWLRDDCCREVVVGYLHGTANREDCLPGPWATFLDGLAADHPELVAVATATADLSARGLDRLLRLLDQLPFQASRFLRPLALGNWLRVLDAEQRVRCAKALVRLADAGDPEATNVGISLFWMWKHTGLTALDQSLAPLALQLASRPLGTGQPAEFHAWREVLQLLGPLYPRQVAELVVARMTELGSSPGWGPSETVDALSRVAEVDPSAAMDAVGDALLDHQRRRVFAVAVFRGLFEAIGVRQVEAWLERHGHEHLRWLARHFPSPYLDELGGPVVPPLTDWLFRVHEADDEAFNWFLMGCHSGTSWYEADVNPAHRRQELRPFLEHELRRAREWAQYEIRHEEREAAFFRELSEENERH